MTDIVERLREFSGKQYSDDICGKTAMAEAAADAIIVLFDDPPNPPENICPSCDGAGEIFRYSSQDPASSIERCFDCDGTGERK